MNARVSAGYWHGCAIGFLLSALTAWWHVELHSRHDVWWLLLIFAGYSGVRWALAQFAAGAEVQG